MNDLISRDDIIERLQFVIDNGIRAKDGDHPLSAEKADLKRAKERVRRKKKRERTEREGE